jgi:hypothetical protein
MTLISVYENEKKMKDGIFRVSQEERRDKEVFGID